MEWKQRLYLSIIFICLTLCSLAFGSTALIVDFNHTDSNNFSKSNQINLPIASRWTWLGIPNLKTFRTMDLGDRTAACFQGDQVWFTTLKLHSNSVHGNPLSQEFQCYSRLDGKELRRFTLPGFIHSEDPLHARPVVYLKSIGDWVYALMFNETGEKQRIIAFDQEGEVKAEYPIPDLIFGKVDFFPLPDHQVIIHTIARAKGNKTFFNLIDLNKSEELQELLVEEKVRKVLEPCTVSNSYFVLLDDPNGIPHEPLWLARLVNRDHDLFLEGRQKLLINLAKNESIMFARTLNETHLLLGVGNSGRISRLYWYEVSKNEAKEVLKFAKEPTWLAVSSDQNYLLAIQPESPQVILYNAQNYSQVMELEKIGQKLDWVLCP